MPLKEFKTKMTTYKKPQNCSDLLVKKCNKEIWQERMNSQYRNKDLKVQKVQGVFLKGAFAICEVTNTLINLKNNKDISDKELKLQLSNVIKICTESLNFLGTYQKNCHQCWPFLTKMSLHHQIFF